MKTQNKNKILISKEILLQKYVRELKSCREIGEELKLSNYIIWKRLQEYGLLRSPSLAIKIAHEKVIAHKRVCQCCICKGKRGELKGNKHYLYGRKGQEANGYKGGRRPYLYPLGWNKTFKEQIRYRDGYKCQNPECGVPEVECIRKLDIHHIDYNKKNLDPDNLISLCKSCHMRTNGNREYWMSYFSQKQGVRNV